MCVCSLCQISELCVWVVTASDEGVESGFWGWKVLYNALVGGYGWEARNDRNATAIGRQVR